MNEIYKTTSHIAWRRVEDEIVILDLNTSAYFSLNEAGARIWELLADGHPVEKAALIIAEEYGKGARTVKADVGEFLKGLRKENLVEMVV